MPSTISVAIVGDSTRLQAATNQATSSLRQLQVTSSQSQQSLSRIDDAFGSLQRGAVALAGVGAVAASLMTVVNAASELQQSTGSVEAVFKGQAAAMLEAGKAAQDIGLSQSQYGKTAALLGAQLKNLGVSQDQVGGKTQELIKHAADMAAMFGTTVPQATEALSSALRGEYERVEAFGISIRQSQVDAEAASKGISRAQATINLIMAQSTDAVGAAAREHDTWASASQRAAAAAANLKAKVGDGLLPVMSALASAASGVAGGLAAIPAPIYTAVAAVAVAVGGWKLLAAGIDRARTALAEYAAALDVTALRGVFAAQAAESFGLLTGVLALVTGAFLAANWVVRDYNERIAAAAPSTDEMAKRLRDLTGSLTELNTAGSKTDWIHPLAGGAESAAVNVTNLGDALRVIGAQDFDSKFRRMRDTISPFTDALDEARAQVLRTADGIGALYEQDPGKAVAAAQELQRQLGETANTADLLAEANQRMGSAAESAATSAGTSAANYKSLSDSFKATKDNADLLKSSLDMLRDGQISADEAEAAYQASLANTQSAIEKISAASGSMGAAVTENGLQFDLTSEAGRNLQSALFDQAKAAQDATAAQFAQNGSMEQAKQSTAAAREQFIATATQMGMNKDAAAKYADQLGLIPSDVPTLLKLNSAQALIDLANWRAELINATQDREVKVTVGYQYPAGPALPNGTVGGVPVPQFADQAVPQLLSRATRSTVVDPTAAGASSVGRINPYLRTQPSQVNVFVDGVKAKVKADPWSPNYVAAVS